MLLLIHRRGNIASGSALAHGVCRSLLVCERGSAGSIGSRGAAHFVILSGEKRRMFESTAFPASKPSRLGEGGERSEPDRVLAR